MELHGIWIFAAVAVLVSISGTFCLRLQEVKIPAHVLRGSPARLECRYELDPGETLYSVKWYKDGDEFFRYVPRDEPPVQAFSLVGVDVDADNCTEDSVTLAPLTLASTGRYRCEVSGEAPLFQTVSDHGDLVVVHVPDTDPVISGGRPRYHVNELARLNCTSGPSVPAATLNWFINGEPADDKAVFGSTTDAVDEDGLHSTWLGLEFRVLPRHFKKGDMKLKCSATIATMYLRSNEESVEGERPLRAPALESRDSAAQSAVNSHADRVQAGNNAISNADRVLLIVPFISSVYCALQLSVR